MLTCKINYVLAVEEEGPDPTNSLGISLSRFLPPQTPIFGAFVKHCPFSRLSTVIKLETCCLFLKWKLRSQHAGNFAPSTEQHA